MFHSNVVPLTPDSHGTFRLNRGSGFGYCAGAAVMPIGIDEFESAARSYPILFTDESPPVPVVLLGFRDGWNLFINEFGAWAPGAYVPSVARAFPFAMIEGDGGSRGLGIEADAACISPTTGDPLFENSEPASLVSDATAFCEACEANLKESIAFGAALERTGVLQPQAANIEVQGGGSVGINGFRTVDRNLLAEMPDDVLLGLRSHNWLLPLYAQLISAANWIPFAELATSQLAARR